MEDEKLQAAKELAWVQRDRLNQLADRLEELLDRNGPPLYRDDAGAWAAAVKAIAESEEETEGFLFNLRGLFHHIRRCYPLEP